MKERILWNVATVVLVLAIVLGLNHVTKLDIGACPSVDFPYDDEYVTECQNGKTIVTDYVTGKVVDVIE